MNRWFRCIQSKKKTNISIKNVLNRKCHNKAVFILLLMDRSSCFLCSICSNGPTTVPPLKLQNYSSMDLDECKLLWAHVRKRVALSSMWPKLWIMRLFRHSCIWLCYLKNHGECCDFRKIIHFCKQKGLTATTAKKYTNIKSFEPTKWMRIATKFSR